MKVLLLLALIVQGTYTLAKIWFASANLWCIMRQDYAKDSFVEFVPEEGAVWRPLAEPEALLVAGDEELDVDEVAVVDGAHLRRRAEELHRRREEPAVGEEGGDGEQYPRGGGVREHLGAVGDCLVGVLELLGTD